jgi:hypothetical protein
LGAAKRTGRTPCVTHYRYVFSANNIESLNPKHHRGGRGAAGAGAKIEKGRSEILESPDCASKDISPTGHQSIPKTSKPDAPPSGAAYQCRVLVDQDLVNLTRMTFFVEFQKDGRLMEFEGIRVQLSKTHCFRLSFCHHARRPSQPPEWLSAPRSFVDPARRQCVSWAFACWEYSALIEAMQCAGTRGSSTRHSALA